MAGGRGWVAVERGAFRSDRLGLEAEVKDVNRVPYERRTFRGRPGGPVATSRTA